MLKETNEVVLNAIELKISNVEFKAGDKTLSASKIDYDEKRETATFTFDQTLPVGGASLKLAFTGILNDKLKGCVLSPAFSMPRGQTKVTGELTITRFYRSKYTNAQKEDAYMGVTQFEPTDARRAIPCWDEPALKATFVLTLVVPKALTALSNMPVVCSPAGGRFLRTCSQ